jgi:hypothetical protein
MRKMLTITIAVLAITGSLAAQTKKPDEQGLTGTWNLGLQGGHVIPVALVLEQDRGTLTGTISLPTQKIGQTVDVALTGEIANGAYTLTGTVEGAKDPTTIEITGKLNDEGMLEGTVTMSGSDASHRGMPYTAERLKERK